MSNLIDTNRGNPSDAFTRFQQIAQKQEGVIIPGSAAINRVTLSQTAKDAPTTSWWSQTKAWLNALCTFSFDGSEKIGEENKKVKQVLLDAIESIYGKDVSESVKEHFTVSKHHLGHQNKLDGKNISSLQVKDIFDHMKIKRYQAITRGVDDGDGRCQKFCV